MEVVLTYIKKEIREKVWNKYGQHCAYCGVKLEYKKMQVDHIDPHWHNMTGDECKKHGLKKGGHGIENFNPSCARCNKWKDTFSIEAFRNEISLQLVRLKRDSSNYRMALDFNMIVEIDKPVEFYFERFK